MLESLNLKPVSPSLLLPESPQALGYPHAEWRPGQKEAIERIHASEKPVIFLSAPTGTGKSLIAAVLADLQSRHDGRTIIATRTIALQDQYLRDFGDRLVRMVGRPNFSCPKGYASAADAICSSGGPCDLKGSDGCPYYAARKRAAAAKTLVVNYDYLAAAWPTRYYSGSPFEDRTLLIGDEAHLADDAIRSTQAIEITTRHLATATQERVVGYPPGRDLALWAGWAAEVVEGLLWVKKIQDQWEEKQGDVSTEEYRRLRPTIGLYRAAEGLLRLLAGGQTVVARPTFPSGLRVEPAFADQGFRALMRGVDKIVLMSATLPGPALTAALLGLCEGDYEVVELPSLFDPKRRPLYYDPTVRVKKGMSDEDLDTLVERIDLWLDRWSDRKGIIHCHSYSLGADVLRRTRHRDRLITHQAKGLDHALGDFRSATDPMWLLSPVAHSGVDLPGELLRGQILCKLPTPDLGDPVVAARKEAIPDTYNQAIAATLIQSYGRGMRAPDDWCETVVLDSNFGWWSKQNSRLLPPWVRDAIIRL